MAKRYFDTNLHNKAWFRELHWQLKEAYRILFAECDVIGIWEINIPALNFAANIPEGREDWITLERLVTTFKSQNLRVVEGDKLFIPGFIPFQYGDETGKLSRKNKLVPKLLRMLEARGLPPPSFKEDSPIYPPSNSDIQSISPMGGVKEEEEDKEQEEEQEKEINGESEGNKPPSDAQKFENSFSLDFNALFAKYPRPQKEGKSIALMREKILDRKTYDQVEKAMDIFSQRCANDGTEMGFILMFPNWWEEWTEWLDPTKAGKPAKQTTDSNWKPKAELVAKALKQFGDWSKNEVAVRNMLGDELYNIAIRASTYEMRQLRAGNYYIPALSGRLKEAQEKMMAAR